jgi:hypothetical protein
VTEERDTEARYEARDFIEYVTEERNTEARYEARDFKEYVTEERGTEGCDGSQRLYRICDWRMGHRGVWRKPETL